MTTKDYTLAKIEREVHDRMKILAIIRGETIQDTINKTLREYLDKNEKELGKFLEKERTEK